MSTPPSVNNYTLGRGKLSIDAYGGSSYVALGNAPSVEVNEAVEYLEHFSSQAGLKLKDKKIATQVGASVNFELDEPVLANLVYFCLGEVVGNSIYALTQITKEYKLKFESFNGVGPNVVWEFPRGIITPNGAMPLIGDDWQKIPLTFECLADVAGNPTSPFFTITEITTTTS
jgi:hypothetical protein